MSTTAIELPLFPLDAVLFPGTVLPLHIIEPRYRRMIADCRHEDKPFGVVLTRPESEHQHEEPYAIGTMAMISDLDELDDGRFRLVAIGVTRFHILRQHHEKPYLSGMVEPFEDDEEAEEILQPSLQKVRKLFSRYLELLLDVDDKDDVYALLPETPEALSHFIAYFLDVRNEQKQHYLELTSTYQRLDEEMTILRKEVPFLRQIIKARPTEGKVMLN